MFRRHLLTALILLLAAGRLTPSWAQGPISNGLTYPASISVPGELDEWTFSTTTGTMILVKMGGQFSPYLALYAPDGTLLTQRLGNGGDRQSVIGVAAPQTGAYRVVVSSRFGTSGSYLLTFALIPGSPQVSPGDQGGPLTNGLTHTGDIYTGDFDQWTFTVTAETTVLLRIGSAFSPYLGLYGPDGVLVTERGSNSSSTITGLTARLTQTGVYTVIVSDYFAGTGAYSLTMALMPGTPQVSPGDQGGGMTNGLTHTGAIYTGDMDQWTFTAVAGTSVTVRIGAAFSPYIGLYGPSGLLVAERAANVASTEAGLTLTAMQTGTYTVIVADSFQGTGNYSLTVALIPGTPQVSPSDQGGPMTNGVTYPGSFYVGDLDQWTFTSVAGAELTVRVTAEFAPYLALYAPDGTLVVERGANVSGLEVEATATAPLNGTYTVLVLDAFLGGAGNYQVRATSVPVASDLRLTMTGGPSPYTPGSNVTFTLTLTNLGPSTATSVVVSDTLPGALTMQSCTATSATCTGTGNARQVSYPSLTSGATRTITLVGRVAAGTTANIANSATVASTSPDPSTANNSASATVFPNTDTDGDGLPNTWETRYGLNPDSAVGDDGASGDPDHDDIDNAQELVRGTHPRGFFVSYLAEGARNAFFEARLAVLNIGPANGRLLFRFLQANGAVSAHFVDLPRLRRITIDEAVLNTLTSPDFSTVLESDQPIVLDRTMSWNGGVGSHAETGVPRPASTWYLAEGSTSGEFSLFYLLQNPNPAATVATVRYLLPFSQAPIVRTYSLPANSRTTIPVDGQGPALAETDVSAVITTPVDAPIIVERAMYRSTPTTPFAAGHGSAGVTAPATRWFLAEGATGPFFDCFILLANPDTQAATVTIDYLLSDGRTFAKTYTVPAQGRSTVWVDEEQIPAGSGARPLQNVAVSSTVTSNVPIIVERTMWWPGPSLAPTFWTEAHNSPGATATAATWALAEGEVGGPQSAETYILIANTSTTAGSARITLYFADGSTSSQTVPLLPRSRRNVNVSTDFPNRPTTTFSAVIESLPVSGNPAAEIVVERAMYTSPGGAVWEAGTNALGSVVR